MYCQALSLSVSRSPQFISNKEMLFASEAILVLVVRTTSDLKCTTRIKEKGTDSAERLKQASLSVLCYYAD